MTSLDDECDFLFFYLEISCECLLGLQNAYHKFSRRQMFDSFLSFQFKKNKQNRFAVLEIRSVSQYFTDQFWVNTVLFSKQPIPKTDSFSRMLIKI